ncbi:hypothetical protein [Micavibrio aeruginosavorus]|uniref:hypothetical protein n=1 Tax=Micavibrio aeruginosavorus TaxID=349221 RepID=UPI003F4AEEC6
MRERLLQDFARARYGVTFRTRAFPNVVEGATEYYRALATDVTCSQWMIQRIVESPVQLQSDLHPVQTSNAQISVVKTGLDFFHAVEYLARAETGYAKDPVGPTRAELGNDHYEAFAVLHLISFDLKGMPQPTLNGHVAISGNYATTALDDLKTSRNADGIKNDLAYKAAHEAYATGSKTPSLVNALVRGLTDYKEAHHVSAIANAWVDVLQTVMGADNRCLTHKQEQYLTKNELYNHLNMRHGFDAMLYAPSSNRVFCLFTRCWNDMQGNFISPESRAVLLEFVKEISTFALVQDAVSMLGAMGAHEGMEFPQKLKEFMWHHAIINLGWRPGDTLKEKIERGRWEKDEKTLNEKLSLLVESTPVMTEVPRHFVEFAASLEKRRSEMEVEANASILKVTRVPRGGTREWI